MSGHHAEAEIEVPGTPEEVWEDVATRDGTSAWLFTTEIDGRQGGEVVIHRQPFGPDARATVTAWDPPHRLGYEEPIEAPDGSPGPPLATEILVQARAGGRCVVRVVSSLGDGGEGWEDLVEGAAQGWRMALVVLRAYRAHFPGQPAAHLDVISPTGRPLADGVAVFAEVAGHLGVAGRATGDSFRSVDADGEGVPTLTGTVEHAADRYVLLRAVEPCPGLVAVSTFPMDGATLTVNVSGRLYGPGAAEVAAREQPRWATWLDRLASHR